MRWQQWVLAAVFCLNILASISQVGKKREPLEAGAVVIATVLYALLVYCVVSL